MKRILLLAAFFFAVSSLVPVPAGRTLLIWPALSPIGAVIAVLSTWIVLRTLIPRGDVILRWTAALTLLLWIPFWIDVVSIVAGDSRGPWKMMKEGLGMWIG